MTVICLLQLQFTGSECQWMYGCVSKVFSNGTGHSIGSSSGSPADSYTDYDKYEVFGIYGESHSIFGDTAAGKRIHDVPRDTEGTQGDRDSPRSCSSQSSHKIGHGSEVWESSGANWG